MLMQMHNVNPITNFGTTRKRQNLVHGDIPKIQSPAEFGVGFDGEKAKGTVEHPFDFCLPLAAFHEGAAK